MATLTTPWFARNLPNGPDGYGKFVDFDEDSDIDKFELTTIDSLDATVAISDAHGGELLVTTGAADDDSCEFQWKAESLKLEGLGKTYWVFGRFKTGEATQSDLRFGLMITDTTFLPGAGTAGASDGVWFGKDDGDTNWDAVYAKDASTFPDDYSKNNGVGTLDTSYHEYAIRIVTNAVTQGTATITYYIDGTPVSAPSTTTLPYDEELALSFGIQNGSAAAKTLTVDYVGYWVDDIR